MIGIGTTLKQRYLLEKELGRGGMGAVYSATDQVLARKVAIKLLKEQGGDEVGKRLRVEARIAARLLHDNVVRIYDFDEDDGISYLIMEEVDGTSYVKRWRSLTLAERLRILAQVADALDYAHHQGVIHRDIKPGNVLLTATDVPKLSDFGLSLLAEQSDEAGAIRGTPHYMSPEQAKGKRLDFRTDLYSLGVMLYESAVGVVPFLGSATAVMASHVGVPPPRPSERNAAIPATLERLILDLLAKVPADRPPSGAAVAEALRQEVDRFGGQGPQPDEAAAAPPVPAGPDLAALARIEEEAGALEPAGPARPPTPSPPRAVAPARPAPPPANAADLVASPMVRSMLRQVLAEPVILQPEERYLMGYYLAHLLIGARRLGILQRRKADRRNADRARLLLAMTYALSCGPTEESVKEAAALLDQQVEVRPALSPVVVAKYLEWRDGAPHRRLFRRTRKALLEASSYARKSMVDAKGVLNPGLMPQSLDDLRKIAPARTVVDDVLVERWNRLAEIWREQPAFRIAALRYASPLAYRDPASQALWPEVVYPVIELARWQRRFRSRAEAVWDALVGKLLHVGDAGFRLDRLLERSVPARVVAQIDDSVNLLARKPPPAVDEDEEDFDAGADEADRLSVAVSGNPIDIDELADDARSGQSRAFVPLAQPDPLRFLQGQLHELWKEAVNALQSQARPAPGRPSPTGHRHIAVGPYRLVVVASIRGRAAGQVAIQGMANKQVEMTTPSFRTTGSAAKPILAIWPYKDNSLVVTHLDFQGATKYILWHAPRAHQLRFDVPEDLLRELQALGMEPPEQLDKALSRWYRPSNKV
ncbi:Serine/threonine-protein kinase PrkC [Aquisphaera giovannonii]|uniref:Serine/threonine-protein kinase PrkC n=1 Tax=Aquisphaera giovannonii TaxID=406548 RepID=A0A5B9WEM2_9BACT|nr:serine/threonine-protein kinase [Aquisphaera giovannonii]QEH38674.1 Serine/threonine-protein kinase PrkC [Aquisphaera giovannonii]